MNLASNFLQMYDACKARQTPEACRKVVLAAVPPMVNVYLTGYDACTQAFSPETCRKYFAPEREKVERWKLYAAFGLGLLIGWRIL